MKKENVLISIFVNLFIPFVILSRFSGEKSLGPYLAIIIAIAFPLIYGGYFLFANMEIKPIPVLGLISIVLTGAIGLMAVNPLWIAIKEALIPLVLGIAVLFSVRTRRPLIKELIFNGTVFNVSDIEEKVRKKGREEELRRVLKNSSYMLAGSFFVSAVLNFILAISIVTSVPGTEEFN